MGKAMDFTKEAYEKKYAIGYGVRYPEGHVIRFYERTLKTEKGITKGRALDFGCGNGVHSHYLASKGFEVFGCDVAEKAIEEARSICDAHKIKPSNFHLITPGQDLRDIFDEESFDVILANQSLYYLDNESLSECVGQLYSLTRPGGMCLFTMMSEKNAYYGMIKERYDNGLSRVVLNNRLKEETIVNFTLSVDQLIKRFEPFKVVHVGQYEPFTYLDRNDEDGCSHHYMFIGEK